MGIPLKHSHCDWGESPRDSSATTNAENHTWQHKGYKRNDRYASLWFHNVILEYTIQCHIWWWSTDFPFHQQCFETVSLFISSYHDSNHKLQITLFFENWLGHHILFSIRQWHLVALPLPVYICLPLKTSLCWCATYLNLEVLGGGHWHSKATYCISCHPLRSNRKHWATGHDPRYIQQTKWTLKKYVRGRVEIEHYSVAYFNRITAFKAL